MAKRMTDREKAIWDAAYAAAFMLDFFELKRVAGWDRAEEVVSAEAATAAADLAIRRLREWRRDENPGAGETVER